MTTKNTGRMKGICGIKVCPFCGGTVEYAGISAGHIFPEAHTGQMYLCKRCGYQGSFILEADDVREIKEIEKECRQLKSAGKLKITPFRFPAGWKWFWRLILVLVVIMWIVLPAAFLFKMLV
ncbi:MAG: hypothetical protein ACXQTY_01515 [Candidatus Methanogasteraceae archaeon]